MSDIQNEDSLVLAAFDFMRTGIAVLPIKPGEKVPAIKGGFKAASKKYADLVEWFADGEVIQNAYTDAAGVTHPMKVAHRRRKNIGAVPGPYFFAIDLDTKPGAKEAFEKLRLPETLTAKTGRDGRHFWFGVQTHQMERLIAHGGQTNGSLGIGIDTRYTRGYVLVPPSVTVGRYEWINNAPVAPLPDHVFNLIIKSGGEQPAGEAIASKPERASTEGEERREDAKPRFESMAAGCAFLEACLVNRANLSEPEWYAGLSFAAASQDSEYWAHELSKDHPGYSSADTAKKLAHARETGPRTCRNIRNELGFAGCDRCPFCHHRDMKSAAALGYQDAEVVQVQRKHVVDAETSRWMNVTTGKVSSRQAADNLFRWRLGRNPHVTFTGIRTTPQVDRFDYVVGENRLIIPEGPEHLVANVWRPGGVTACDGDASALIGHLTVLIPDEASRTHVLRYLGHLVQHPAVKIAHSLILSGAQGTGKSTLTLLLQRLLGEANVRSIGGDALLNRFKADLINIQVACVEEANHGYRYEVANNLKTWFSEEYMPVEEKGIPMYRGRTPRGILIFSNYSAPLVIEKTDRRFFICKTTDTKAPDAYFQALYRAIHDDQAVGAFKQWLMDVDLSGFNPKAEPPRTSARDEAERDSLPPIAQELMEALDEEHPIFAHDLFEKHDIERYLDGCTNLRTSVTKQKVKEALGKIGARKIGRVRTGTGPRQQHNLWAIRNHEHWAARDHAELASAYKGILAAKGRPVL